MDVRPDALQHLMHLLDANSEDYPRLQLVKIDQPISVNEP